MESSRSLPSASSTDLVAAHIVGAGVSEAPSTRLISPDAVLIGERCAIPELLRLKKCTLEEFKELEEQDEAKRAAFQQQRKRKEELLRELRDLRRRSKQSLKRKQSSLASESGTSVLQAEPVPGFVADEVLGVRGVGFLCSRIDSYGKRSCFLPAHLSCKAIENWCHYCAMKYPFQHSCSVLEGPKKHRTKKNSCGHRLPIFSENSRELPQILPLCTRPPRQHENARLTKFCYNIRNKDCPLKYCDMCALSCFQEHLMNCNIKGIKCSVAKNHLSPVLENAFNTRRKMKVSEDDHILANLRPVEVVPHFLDENGFAIGEKFEAYKAKYLVEFTALEQTVTEGNVHVDDSDYGGGPFFDDSDVAHPRDGGDDEITVPTPVNNLEEAQTESNRLGQEGEGLLDEADVSDSDPSESGIFVSETSRSILFPEMIYDDTLTIPSTQRGTEHADLANNYAEVLFNYYIHTMESMHSLTSYPPPFAMTPTGRWYSTEQLQQYDVVREVLCLRQCRIRMQQNQHRFQNLDGSYIRLDALRFNEKMYFICSCHIMWSIWKRYMYVNDVDVIFRVNTEEFFNSAYKNPCLHMTAAIKLFSKIKPRVNQMTNLQNAPQNGLVPLSMLENRGKIEPAKYGSLVSGLVAYNTTCSMIGYEKIMLIATDTQLATLRQFPEDPCSGGFDFCVRRV